MPRAGPPPPDSCRRSRPRSARASPARSWGPEAAEATPSERLGAVTEVTRDVGDARQSEPRAAAPFHEAT